MVTILKLWKAAKTKLGGDELTLKRLRLNFIF